jgi:hypothetical protein
MFAWKELRENIFLYYKKGRYYPIWTEVTIYQVDGEVVKKVLDPVFILSEVRQLATEQPALADVLLVSSTDGTSIRWDRNFFWYDRQMLLNYVPGM